MAENIIKKCPYCGKEPKQVYKYDRKTLFHYDCPCCGEFDIPYIDIIRMHDLPPEEKEIWHRAICKGVERRER